MQTSWKAILGVVLSASLVLGGCGGMGLTKGGSEGVNSLSENQVLRMSEQKELQTLDSAKASEMISFNVLNNVQEGLMRMGKEKQPEFGIAQDVDISPDKKTYTFKLRDDATWSDGKPVTAMDFEYGWKRALDPKTKSEYAYMLYPIVNAEEYNTGKVSSEKVGVKATNETTLVVKLKQPMINFLSMTTMTTYMPQRADIVAKYKNEYGTKADKVVYNGPFKVTKWTNQEVALTKNDQYWDRNAVTLEKVSIITIKDTATGINLYNSGNIDTALLNQAFVDAYKQTPDYVEVELASTCYILLNQKNEFFKNDKIRKAISLAIDREDIIKVMKDGSKPAGALIPPSINGEGNKSFRENGEWVKQDVDKAKKYFAEGLKELGLEKPPTDIEMIGYDATAKRDVAMAIEEQLRVNLGLDIQLNSPPWKVHLDKLRNGDYDMGMLTWGADYNDPINFFEIWQAKNPMNWSNFNNNRYDQLVEQTRRETDQKKQFKLFTEAEKILAGTEGNGMAGFVPLFYASQAYVQKPYVKDLYRHPYGAQYTLKWAYIGKEKEKN
ncbi:peptide ABC transporter substrate-binding protein [Paenactinomyces guangxiensis]|uniref:Peptide ABC transporter substrate-binding protein n=1 Tax=Paenactinomyces guangxiensis TaxID=1490290 RepID=A0A7W2A8E0_9BACL|nr:peptide ABC transporter substrate-binding protein [Paenactinomyces guangxiensis]MBA4493728.1 peptide ABC transporter substrate-binding protein [Paenactinomyces guangxiensis]MBH8591016.1 peptide ABC transporter substrate-binding protein [Paenactinomyces guangxiensis]